MFVVHGQWMPQSKRGNSVLQMTCVGNYMREFGRTIGRTVILAFGVCFAFHTLVRAADIVVFPDPGVPAKATRIRRRDEAGFFSRSTLNLSHNVVIVSSMFVLVGWISLKKGSVALLSGDDQLEYCTISSGSPNKFKSLVVDTENALNNIISILATVLFVEISKTPLCRRRHLPPMIGRETVSRHRQ